METPPEAQKVIYGTKRGPPMLYEVVDLNPSKRPTKRRKMTKSKIFTEQLISMTRQHQRMTEAQERSQNKQAQDPQHVVSPCTLPGGFPPELAHRALAAYGILRTLSRELRLSPFTPNVFLRALYLPYPNKVMGQVHVALLRVLLPQLQMGFGYKPKGGGIHVHKRRSVDNLRWKLRAGDNLTYLDGLSWPLFLDDYCHLTADRLWAKIHDEESHIDFRYMGMQHMDTGVKDYSDGQANDDSSDDDEQGNNYNYNYNHTTNQSYYPQPSYPQQPLHQYPPSAMSNANHHQMMWSMPQNQIFNPTMNMHMNVNMNMNVNVNMNMNVNVNASGSTSSMAAGVSAPVAEPQTQDLGRGTGRNSRNTNNNSSTAMSGSDSEYDNDNEEDEADWSPRKEKRRRAATKKKASPMNPPRSSEPPTSASKRPHLELPLQSKKKALFPTTHQTYRVLPRPVTTERSKKVLLGSKVLSVESPVPGLVSKEESQISNSHGSPSFHVEKRRALPVVRNAYSSIDRTSSKVVDVTVATPTTRPGKPRSLGFEYTTTTSTTKEKDVVMNDKPKASSSMDKEQAKRSNDSNKAIDTEKADTKVTSIDPKSSADKDEKVVGSETKIKEKDRSVEQPKLSSAEEEPAETLNGPTKERTMITSDPKSTVDKDEKNDLLQSAAKQEVSSSPTKKASPNKQAPSKPSATKEDSPRTTVSRRRKLPMMGRKFVSNKPVPPSSTDQHPTDTNSSEHSPPQSSPNSTGESTKRPRGRPRGKLPLHNSSSKRPLSDPLASQPALKKQAIIPPQQLPQQMIQSQRYQMFQMQQMQMRQYQMQQQIMANPQLYGIRPPPQSAYGINPNMVPSTATLIQQQTMRQQTMMASQGGRPMMPGAMPYSSMVKSMSGEQISGYFVKNKGLEVPADVATALQNFMCGIEVKPTNDASEGGGKDSKIGDKEKSNDDVDEKKWWSHFEPLKAMRTGVPYYKLPITQKITILEFLIDELLALNTISAEFTKRQAMSDCYSFPYGLWPTETEFENLENADECGVCGGEGELLCCDGCVASYHRGCLDMSPGQALPEGKWLCPECKLVDPSMFGPMRGGRKASLDWVAVDDLLDAFKYNETASCVLGGYVNSTSLLSNPNPSLLNIPVADFGALGTLRVGPAEEANPANNQLASTLNLSTIGKALVESTEIPNQGSSTPDNNHHAVTDVLEPPTTDATTAAPREDVDHVADPTIDTMDTGALVSSQSLSNKPDPAAWKGVEFLVVHSFVFCRKTTASAEKESGETKGQLPYLVLPKAEVDKYLQAFGSKISKAWPFAQISTNETSSVGHFPSVKMYLTPLDSFDPSFYTSRYKKAPIPILMKAGAGSQIGRLMLSDYDSECSQSSTYRVSEALIRDLKFDMHISACLRSELSFFDPYQMVKGYMVRLETVLKKACLLNEFWETGNDRASHDVWLSNVRNCKSANRLARLLVSLVDRIHPRTFLEGWSYNPHAKSSESSTAVSDRNYKDLPADWNEKNEIRKRRWERTTPSLMLGFATKEGCDLEYFVEGIRSDFGGPVTVTRSKRKQAKPDSPVNSLPVEATKHEDAPPVIASQVSFPPPTKNTKDGNDASVVVSQPETLSTPNVESVTQSQATIASSLASATPVNDAGNGVVDMAEISASINLKQEMTAMMPANGVLSIVAAEISAISEPMDISLGAALHQNMSNGVATSSSELQAPICSVREEFTVSLDTAHVEDVAAGTLSSTNARNVKNGMTEIAASNIKNVGPPISTPGVVGELETASSSNAPNVANPVEGIASEIDETTKASDTTVGDTDSGGKNAKKTKKPKNKTKKAEKESSRRTRRSGRLSRYAPEPDQPGIASEAGPSLVAEVRRARPTLGDMEYQIESLKKKKMPEVQKLLKRSFSKELDWPVAGRKLFATFGDLPRWEMKHLARNAGVVKAASLAYSTSHEVGQVCLAYVWRKETQLCSGLEQLVFQIRVLESFLDRSTIHSCESVVRRGKAQIQKVVRCSIRDPLTGTMEHFVVNKGRMKGCWIPAEQMDVSSLILENFTRKQRQAAIYMEKVRVREKVEKDRMEKERAKRADEAARLRMEKAKEAKEAKAAKAAKLQAQAQAIAIAKRKQQDALRRALPPQHVPLGKPRMSNIQPPNTGASPQLELTKWNTELRNALSRHQTDMGQLFQACLLSGTVPVPQDQLEPIRRRTMTLLKIVAEGLGRCNLGISTTDAQLEHLMNTTEEQAIKNLTKTGVSNASAGNLSPSPSRERMPPTPRSVQNETTTPSTSGLTSKAIHSAMSTPSTFVGGAPAPASNLRQQYPAMGARSFATVSATRSPGIPASGSRKKAAKKTSVVGSHVDNNRRQERKRKQPPVGGSFQGRKAPNQQMTFGDDLDMEHLFDDSPGPRPTTATNGIDNRRLHIQKTQQNQHEHPGISYTQGLPSQLRGERAGATLSLTHQFRQRSSGLEADPNRMRATFEPRHMVAGQHGGHTQPHQAATSQRPVHQSHMPQHQEQAYPQHFLQQAPSQPQTTPQRQQFRMQQQQQLPPHTSYYQPQAYGQPPPPQQQPPQQQQQQQQVPPHASFYQPQAYGQPPPQQPPPPQHQQHDQLHDQTRQQQIEELQRLQQQYQQYQQHQNFY